jgi:two-component system, NarL family, nitrate/nitrite response regulator NarL
MLTSDKAGAKPERARILIADGTPMGAQLLADALRRSGRFASVCVADRATDVLTLMASQPIDVLLTSDNFEGGTGLDLAREVCVIHSRAKVLMLLETLDRELVVEAFRAGCRGVFGRAQSVKHLVKCLVCIHCEQIWAGSQELTYVVQALREPKPFRVINTENSALLTGREMAVVRCVADGLTNKEVAAKLGLSQHTIKNYLFRIFDKLSVSSRIELIYYAMNHATQAARVA